jgi:putative SOS response-associated peptidase YedK
MCGRYAITLPPEAMKQLFGYPETPNFPPRYNIAPTQPVPVIRHENGPRFALMRWGFIPGWVKDIKDFPLVINVRSETAREKPSFRAAIQRRRALMPADGFYEWWFDGSRKRPFLFRRPDRSLFAFAAIWETWSSADGSEIDTVALVNTVANGQMSAIHHRSPVILDPAVHAAWLDPMTEVGDAMRLLTTPPEDLLEMVEIGTAINKVSNDNAEVQVPAAAAPAPATPPAAKPAGRKPAVPDGGQGSLF